MLETTKEFVWNEESEPTTGPTMSDVLEDDGSETIAVFSMFFVKHTKRYIVVVWGDDFARSMALRRGRQRAL